jgi:uncharacterized protein (DUF849 family)
MHARKTIITCAVTGNLTKPEQHPGLPIVPAGQPCLSDKIGPRII